MTFETYTSLYVLKQVFLHFSYKNYHPIPHRLNSLTTADKTGLFKGVRLLRVNSAFLNTFKGVRAKIAQPTGGPLEGFFNPPIPILHSYP